MLKVKLNPLLHIIHKHHQYTARHCTICLQNK